jgi:hypothetical protein
MRMVSRGVMERRAHGTAAWPDACMHAGPASPGTSFACLKRYVYLDLEKSTLWASVHQPELPLPLVLAAPSCAADGR